MTKFEDQLYQHLMTEHGDELRAQERPWLAHRPARRLLARRPVWLATGGAGVAAAVTATVMALGSAPAYAAFSVTRSANGSVSVSVNSLSGVAGANATLHRMRLPIVVVPVGAGCPPITSLPIPRPLTWIRAEASVGRDGRYHAFKAWVGSKHAIPAGTTYLLAFRGNSHHGSVVFGSVITGALPRCVSLPRWVGSGTDSSGPAPAQGG